jgi:hypothetical protein
MLQKLMVGYCGRVSGSANRCTGCAGLGQANIGASRKARGTDMADKVLEELLVSSEVQTARDRLEDYDGAEAAAEANPKGEQELEDLREALVDMPGAVRMLLEAIDRAGAEAGEPQYDPSDTASSSG